MNNPSKQATRIAQAAMKMARAVNGENRLHAVTQYCKHAPVEDIAKVIERELETFATALLAPAATEQVSRATFKAMLEAHRKNYEVIEIRKDLIPKGGQLVEAYETEREIIVIGEPEDEPEGLSPDEMERWYETAHNCDAMSCGTLSHVIYRFSKVSTEASLAWSREPTEDGFYWYKEDEHSLAFPILVETQSGIRLYEQIGHIRDFYDDEMDGWFCGPILAPPFNATDIEVASTAIPVPAYDLASLRKATNEACGEAFEQRSKIKEPVNWGNLECVKAEYAVDDNSITSYRVLIAGASPSCQELPLFIFSRLEAMGFQGVEVHTEW